MEIKSDKIEIVSLASLVPHEKNMHMHSPEQIDRLIKLIEYQGYRQPIIVQKGTNKIVAGHGRAMALLKMGVKDVPVMYQEFESEAQLYAFMVSDNAIGKDTWATLDLSQINTDIADLGEFDLELLGLRDFNVETLCPEDYGDKNKEIDTDNFGNDLQHTCPKCGFEFNE
jgi:ParB-like chromosome segregation protein Spo0J